MQMFVSDCYRSVPSSTLLSFLLFLLVSTRISPANAAIIIAGPYEDNEGKSPACIWADMDAPSYDRATSYSVSTPMCLDAISVTVHSGDTVVLLEGDYKNFGPDAGEQDQFGFYIVNQVRANFLNATVDDPPDTTFVALPGTVVTLYGLDFATSQERIRFENLHFETYATEDHPLVTFYHVDASSQYVGPKDNNTGDLDVTFLHCSFFHWANTEQAAIDFGFSGGVKTLTLIDSYIYSKFASAIQVNPDEVTLNIHRSQIVSSGASGEIFTVDDQDVLVNATITNSIFSVSRGGLFSTLRDGSEIAITNTYIDIRPDTYPDIFVVGDGVTLYLLNSIVIIRGSLLFEVGVSSVLSAANTRFLSPVVMAASSVSEFVVKPELYEFLQDEHDPYENPYSHNSPGTYNLYIDEAPLLATDLFGNQRNGTDTIGPVQLNDIGEVVYKTKLLEFARSTEELFNGVSGTTAFTPSYLIYGEVWQYETGSNSINNGDRTHNLNIALDQVHCLGDIDFDGEEDVVALSSSSVNVWSSKTGTTTNLEFSAKDSASIDADTDGHNDVIFLSERATVSLFIASQGDINQSQFVTLFDQLEATDLYGTYLEYLDDINGDGVKEIGVVLHSNSTDARWLLTLFSSSGTGAGGPIHYSKYSQLEVTRASAPMEDPLEAELRIVRDRFIGLTNCLMIWTNEGSTIGRSISSTPNASYLSGLFVDVLQCDDSWSEVAVEFPLNRRQLSLEQFIIGPNVAVSSVKESICFGQVPSPNCFNRVHLRQREMIDPLQHGGVTGFTRRAFDVSGSESLKVHLDFGQLQLVSVLLKLEIPPLEPFFDYSSLPQEVFGVDTSFNEDVVISTPLTIQTSTVLVESNVQVNSTLVAANSTITIREGATLTVTGGLILVDTTIVLGVDSETSAALFTIGGCPQFTNAEFIIERNSTDPKETEFSIPLYTVPTGGDCPDTDITVTLATGNDKYCSTQTRNGNTFSAIFLLQASCPSVSSPSPSGESGDSIATFFGKDWLIWELILLVVGVILFLALLVAAIIYLVPPLRNKVFKFRSKTPFRLETP